MYANHFPSLTELYYSHYFRFIQCGLINTAIPLFIFTSGYLFIYLINNGKYKTFSDLALKKSKRLLLPYFVFGIIMMWTTGQGFNPIKLLDGCYWHLWFLPMLFWCFVLSWLIRNFIQRLDLIYGFIFLIICFGFSLLPKLPVKIMCIHGLPLYYCWFYMGIFCYQNRDRITDFLSKHKKIYISLLLLYFIIFLWPIEYADIRWYGILQQSVGILCIWHLTHIIPWENMQITKYITSFSKYCFGIYIFHNWIGLFMVSPTAQSIFNLENFAENHIILFPLTLFLINFIISFILTKLCLITKPGRFILG